ncbi:membrane protein [Anopheles sinensis]|uniref:Membrane protein n=1 Tax=Anopheles sinensis TaxID=74873 RepID=A0A084VG23_ANOSI|nr:membrane protein [Anopheles sinensis]
MGTIPSCRCRGKNFSHDSTRHQRAPGSNQHHAIAMMVLPFEVIGICGEAKIGPRNSNGKKIITITARFSINAEAGCHYCRRRGALPSDRGDRRSGDDLKTNRSAPFLTANINLTRALAKVGEGVKMLIKNRLPCWLVDGTILFLLHLHFLRKRQHKGIGADGAGEGFLQGREAK